MEASEGGGDSARDGNPCLSGESGCLDVYLPYRIRRESMTGDNKVINKIISRSRYRSLNVITYIYLRHYRPRRHNR